MPDTWAVNAFLIMAGVALLVAMIGFARAVMISSRRFRQSAGRGLKIGLED